MFLSRVEINPYRRETMKALGSPQILHAAVMASFGSFDGAEDDRVLWRVDRVGSATYILVQSRRKPDFNHIVDQFGRPGTETGWDTVDYDAFLDGICDGDVLRFRLRANPTHSVSSLGNGSRGKVVAHVTTEQQKAWLLGKAEKNGFRICGGVVPDFDVVQREWARFNRDGRTVSINMVTFEGVLEVTDRDVFVRSMKDGIGRAKSYGCGLMTVMRS